MAVSSIIHGCDVFEGSDGLEAVDVFVDFHRLPAFHGFMV